MASDASTDGELIAIGRHPLVAHVRRSLFGPCGVRAGDGVIVAVSGGADSLALMLALTAIARRSRRSAAVDPVVVHVNHRLRAGADADARFVARQCARLQVVHEGIVVDVADHVRRAGGNIESAARDLRYGALEEAARRHGATAVVTAHHAEDQLETILMNICRGCGPAALGAMPWRRPISTGARQRGTTAVSLVRPLLESPRDACRELCRVARRRWRTDPTNADRERSRARLRADVLPILEAMWPGCAVRAARTAAQLRSEFPTDPPLTRETRG